MNPESRTRQWLPEFLLLAALWGSSFLFMRLSATEFGPLPTAGVRVAVAALFLLPLVVVKKQLPSLKQNWRKIFFLGTINSGLPFAFFAYALLSVSTGLTSLINATVPLFGALVAWIWLKDRPQGLKVLGLVLGFAGVAMLAWGKASFKPNASGYSSALGILACFAACLCYGIAASFTRRHLSGINALVVATGSQVGATLALALPTVWLWPEQAPSLRAWLSVLTVGVFCTAIAYVLFFRLIEKLGAATSLTVTFLIPVFANIYGMAFLDETITTWMLICAPIILLGTALSLGLFSRPRTSTQA